MDGIATFVSDCISSNALEWPFCILHSAALRSAFRLRTIPHQLALARPPGTNFGQTMIKMIMKTFQLLHCCCCSDSRSGRPSVCFSRSDSFAAKFVPNWLKFFSVCAGCLRPNGIISIWQKFFPRFGFRWRGVSASAPCNTVIRIIIITLPRPFVVFISLSVRRTRRIIIRIDGRRPLYVPDQLAKQMFLYRTKYNNYFYDWDSCILRRH